VIADVTTTAVEETTMAIRSADAEWKGSLADGNGSLSTESGALKGSYTFRSRFEEGEGTNPEELIAAAHAGCYSMALSHGLSQAGHVPENVRTTAEVHLEKVADGFAITKVELRARARVPGLDAETFQDHARQAKAGCPVSKALKALEITLDAELES